MMKDDMATTSRQSLKENDPRYEALLEHLKTEIRKIGSQWTDLRTENIQEEAKQDPLFKEWHDNLSEDKSKIAKRMFNNISNLDLKDQERKTLYGQTAVAIEWLDAKGKLNMIEKFSETKNFDKLMKILGDIDNVEAAKYFEITHTRLDVIKQLKDKVDTNEYEKVIQKVPF